MTLLFILFIGLPFTTIISGGACGKSAAREGILGGGKSGGSGIGESEEKGREGKRDVWFWVFVSGGNLFGYEMIKSNICCEWWLFLGF